MLILGLFLLCNCIGKTNTVLEHLYLYEELYQYEALEYVEATE